MLLLNYVVRLIMIIWILCFILVFVWSLVLVWPPVPVLNRGVTIDLTHPPHSCPAGIVVGVFLPCLCLQGLILHRFIHQKSLCKSLTHFEPSGKSSGTIDLTHPPHSCPAGIVVGVFLPCLRLQGLILHRLLCISSLVHFRHYTILWRIDELYRLFRSFVWC